MTVLTAAVPAPRTAMSGPGKVFVAEATGAAGLVLVPDLRGAAFTGRWRLAQEGHRLDEVVSPDTTLTYARELAVRFAATGIDWTRPLEEIRADPDAYAAALAVVGAFTAAEREQRPLWWARTSWVSRGPLWRIGIGDDEVMHLPFAAVWTLLDQYPGDAHIGYDPAPTWTLRCAAPMCEVRDGAELFVPGESDDVFRHANRQLLAVEAVAGGWRRRGDHWMCPHCAFAHQLRPSTGPTW